MNPIALFLAGDVMTGRGIDQILPHPGRPQLFEPFVKSARDYVTIAERESGRIGRPVDYAYIWGEALAVLDRMRPDARIVNLEASVTTSEDHWAGKDIHYRMHPANVPALKAAKLDCCVLANNHMLDWGRQGLIETLDVLHTAGLRTAGAGRNREEAGVPACIEPAGKGRVWVFGCAVESSGVPRDWAAAQDRAGVFLLPDLSPLQADAMAQRMNGHKRPGDIAVVSIHWGPNWGYGVSSEQRDFARSLVEAGADVVHGHSSHHVKGIEVYRDRPILYGCGDLLNDYEGIAGYEAYRPDLALMYFPTLDASGRLLQFALVPARIRHLRVNRASEEGATWLQATLNREGRKFGTQVEWREQLLMLRWT